MLLFLIVGLVHAGERCGPVRCGDDEQCCNSSCGICVSEGRVCELLDCGWGTYQVKHKVVRPLSSQSSPLLVDEVATFVALDGARLRVSTGVSPYWGVQASASATQWEERRALAGVTYNGIGGSWVQWGLLTEAGVREDTNEATPVLSLGGAAAWTMSFPCFGAWLAHIRLDSTVDGLGVDASVVYTIDYSSWGIPILAWSISGGARTAHVYGEPGLDPMLVAALRQHAIRGMGIGLEGELRPSGDWMAGVRLRMFRPSTGTSTSGR